MTSSPCGWVPNVGCCDDWSNYSAEVRAAALEYGSYVMWAATGRQFGLCDMTVRPCGRYRGTSPEFWGFFWSGQGGWWVPYVDGYGVWRNCWCGNRGCTCQPDCQVYLPGPVYSVSEVLVDGVALDPSAYRVDDGHWLVRTDGDCWPECADLNVDSGAGLFEVSYTRGQVVPDVVLTAAGTLACEYAKACVGGACRLPGRITSIARQGVTVTAVDTDTLLRRGLTGIFEVDQVISAVNPAGLRARPRVYSPDRRSPRTVTSA